ncbi:hypothetical protein, partial [Pseudomonas sp. GXM4]|uniref:hypothetical protein n=1 Tax=Pseudomonas sp. GXM4 TaxID=2651867 RepID=UPI001C49BC63
DGHLRTLILELLTGSQAITNLRSELSQLISNSDEGEGARLLAATCLLELKDYDYQMDLAALIAEASYTSLKIAADIITAIGPEKFDRAYLADAFRACAKLYPNQRNPYEKTVGARFFMKRLVAEFNLDLIEWLLDELTSKLICTCQKKYYQCDCRFGISRIIGLMLDRYFELAIAPFEPERIWQWMKGLTFHEQRSPNQSKSIQVFQNNDALRQGVMACAFGNLNNSDEIFETRIGRFELHSHSGLRFQTPDYKYMVDFAFENDNPALWADHIAMHRYHQNDSEKGPNSLRHHMREQALKKPSLMREWYKFNRSNKQSERANQKLMSKHTRRMKRLERQRGGIHQANILYFQANRDLIESGRDWKCLVRFAELALMSPDKIEVKVGDEALVRNALRNCLDFITPQIPDLSKLAELQCASQHLTSETVLFAACMEVMRTVGSLKNIDLRLLRALRTNIDMGYNAVTSEERDSLKTEVNRLIFAEDGSAEDFLREYVEPQLAQPDCLHPEIWLLRGDEVFKHLRASLSIEWLRRFPELSLEPLDTLFEIATESGDREALQQIIAERCAHFISEWPSPTSDESLEKKRIFWFVRSFYFIEETPQAYWIWLASDKEMIFELYERTGRSSYSNHPFWPKLTSIKVECILNAFIDKWPKVELPPHWGSGYPNGENAYRFLTEVVWLINLDDSDDADLVLDRLLFDNRFKDMFNDLKSIRTGKIRQNALRDFEPPTPEEIVNRLDRDMVVNVEGLRQLVLQELQDFQKAIDGGEFDSASRFYEKGDRLGEVPATLIIAERLNIRLESQGISITPEHQLKSANRSDFTATKLIGGKRRLLVTEVKGQWHKDLYTAASAQLYDRYSIHPDAEQQGIYLAIWFGPGEKVAGLKNTIIKTAQELKESIQRTLPPELAGLIDVFVLDVSKP